MPTIFHKYVFNFFLYALMLTALTACGGGGGGGSADNTTNKKPIDKEPAPIVVGEDGVIIFTATTVPVRVFDDSNYVTVETWYPDYDPPSKSQYIDAQPCFFRSMPTTTSPLMGCWL